MCAFDLWPHLQFNTQQMFISDLSNKAFLKPINVKALLAFNLPMRCSKNIKLLLTRLFLNGNPLNLS